MLTRESGDKHHLYNHIDHTRVFTPRREDWYVKNISNIRFVHSRFDSNIIPFYTSYSPYDQQNSTRPSQSNRMVNEFEYDYVGI
jgi:hypothetical protein